MKKLKRLLGFVLIFLVNFVGLSPVLHNFDIWGDGFSEPQLKNNISNLVDTGRTPKGSIRVTDNFIRNNKFFYSMFDAKSTASSGAQQHKMCIVEDAVDLAATFLNFFSLPEENECTSNDGRRKGICLNTYECRIQGGKSFGACALGFGVCCVFTATCDSQVYNNITYFVNPDFPSLSHGMNKCSLKIKKIDPEISQFRLDFIHFHLGQPNRRTGVCDDDLFVMSGGNARELRLCGLNSGQHVYVDVENFDEQVSISMTLSKQNVGRLWEVRVTQVPFNQRAPNGCLQFYTGRRGVVKTMNFAENGRRLANQDYTICMRQERGMCSIAYEPCDENSFKIGAGSSGNNGVGVSGNGPQQGVQGTQGNPANSPGSQIGEEFGSGDGGVAEARSCSDRIIMPCDSDDLIIPGSTVTTMCDLVHCGTSLCPGGGATCRVESSVTPFIIGVQFGPGAREESPDDNLGMCLRYEQLPCIV